MSDWADDLDDEFSEVGQQRSAPSEVTLRIGVNGRHRSTCVTLTASARAMMPFDPHLRCRPQWHRVGAVLRLVPDASGAFQWRKSPLGKGDPRWILRFRPTLAMDDDVYTRAEKTTPEWVIRNGALLVKVPDVFLTEQKGSRQ